MEKGTEFHSFIYFKTMLPSRRFRNIIKSSSKVMYTSSHSKSGDWRLFHVPHIVQKDLDFTFIHKIIHSVDALFAACWTKWKLKSIWLRHTHSLRLHPPFVQRLAKLSIAFQRMTNVNICPSRTAPHSSEDFRWNEEGEKYLSVHSADTYRVS